MRGRTRITIDYALCGGLAPRERRGRARSAAGAGEEADPRACCRCLRVCPPAVFHLHQTPGVREPDPLDPQSWRVTALWPTLCIRCRRCVEACPRGAIRLSY